MRVLIIEDELHIRNFLRVSLEAECYAVDSAGDGRDGLQLLLQNEYDVVVLDNQLPGMPGAEVCRQARTAGVKSAVIGLSVVSEVNAKVEFLNAGADDYMTKPFSFEELLARLRALLRRPKQVEGDVLKVGDIELYVREHRVVRDGEEVCLTKKEFGLLEYLMRNRGMVLSRGMIMEHVWDMNADPFSYTIEAHVTSLRRKLRDRDQHVIRTVTGSGYKVAI